MKYAAHLFVEELVLAPSREWTPTMGGWFFFRLNQGQAYWIGEGAAVDLSRGDVLVLPPVRMGLMRASQLGTAQIHYFRFCPDQLAGLLTMSERQYLDRAASKPRIVPWHLGSNHTAARLFARAVESGTSDESLVMRAILLQVVAMCFDWKSNDKNAAEGSVLPASKRMRLLMDELTEMELCEIAPGELAAQCGCSVQHFNRLFQSQFGLPFRTRQNELRLLKARELLVESGASVQDIARRVGCRHVSYFNSQFKKEFGLTPSEFRRQKSKARPVPGGMGKLVA